MTIKGQVVDLLSRAAIQSPLRRQAEEALRRAGHRYPTSRTVQSFGRHLGAAMMRREGDAFERVVTFASGGKMRCGPDDGIGLHCLQHYFLGTITGQTEDERPIVRFLDQVVRRGDVFFDVGTNLGFYSLYLGPLCGKDGEIHAFEANPKLIAPLQKSIRLNAESSNIILNDVAVGRESNKTMTLYDPELIGNSSFYAHGWLNKASSVEVPVISLDDYVERQKIKKFSGMKIDIEGAELEAFEGMRRIFATIAPNYIVCELMPSGVSQRAAGAARPTDVVAFLSERGYSGFELKDNGGRPLTRISAAQVESAPQIVNVVFARADFVGSRSDLFAPS
jgi:FkbM family methyltransferase